MNKFLQVLLVFLVVSISELASASSGAYLAGRQAISDHNFVTASKFQARSISADPANSKLLESLMISFIAQGSVDEAISIAEVYKGNGNVSQISQMILLASMVKDGQTKAFLDFVKNASEITPKLKDLLSAGILMGLDDEVNANRIFDKIGVLRGFGPVLRPDSYRAQQTMQIRTYSQIKIWPKFEKSIIFVKSNF